MIRIIPVDWTTVVLGQAPGEADLPYPGGMKAIDHRTALRNRALHLGRRFAPSSPAAVREALNLLAPWEVGTPLVRIGGDGDGGYLVPDLLDGVEALFSPGVSDTWDFERFVAERYGIPSFMLDGSVDAPPGLTDLQHFRRLWLGTRTRAGSVTLEDWVATSRVPTGADLLLQMDIEGAEYRVLAATPLSTLRRFRIAVVEFHGLDWTSVAPVLRTRILPALLKMSVDFKVVHVHPNNCCGVEMIQGFPMPRVLEVTYLRRDFVSRDVGLARIPHPLDRDCVPGNAKLDLPENWPRLSG